MDENELLIDSLIAWVDIEFDKIKGRNFQGDIVNLVNIILLAKSVMTLRAIKTLMKSSDGAYVIDAAILVRSLFENYIDLAYIHHYHNPKRKKVLGILFTIDGIKRQRKFLNSSKDKSENILNNPQKLKATEEKLKSEFNELCPKFDMDAYWKKHENTWVDKSIYKRAKRVGLKDLFNGPYTKACTFSHPNIIAGNEYVAGNHETNGLNIFTKPRGNEWTDGVSYFSAVTLLKIIETVAESLGIQKEYQLSGLTKLYDKLHPRT